MQLILASKSPRRRELLSRITTDFQVVESRADEFLPDGIGPEDAVCLLSMRKAESVLHALPEQDVCVIGSDTVVTIDGEILGKPHSFEQCCSMLHRLSGREHTVCTGLALLTHHQQRICHTATSVRFYPLSEEEISWYASTEEPYDKAGAYGIQGLGSLLVQEIHGDYFSVMGLPVARLWRELREFGFRF